MPNTLDLSYSNEAYFYARTRVPYFHESINSNSSNTKITGETSNNKGTVYYRTNADEGRKGDTRNRAV